MEAMRSSETLAFTSPTRFHIQEGYTLNYVSVLQYLRSIIIPPHAYSEGSRKLGLHGLVNIRV
jgi:hypothetical protein